MTPDEQRILIIRSADALGKLMGSNPEGWMTPTYSADAGTYELLVEAGFAWHADALDASFPSLHKTPKGSIVALPWSDFVDNRVLRASPRDYVDVYKGTFDYLRTHEPLSLLNLALHSHFGGRPMMTAVADEILSYFRKFDDVWFARHGELAHWFSGLKADDMPYASRYPSP
jgi:hypothetical protein